jgi:hypothetical protein
MSNKANLLRAALKTAGYNRNQVTVAYPHSTLRVTIRDASIPKSAIKAIAGAFEHVDRDYMTGEILCGGNTFVTVEYTDEILRTLAQPIAAELERAEPNVVVDVAGRRVAKMAPGVNHWAWEVCSTDDLQPRITAHAGDGSVDHLMFAAKLLAEGAIEIGAKSDAV